MSNGEKKVGPSVEVAAAENVNPKAINARLNDYRNYIPPRSVKGSAGWVHAPANLKVLTLAERGLMTVGNQRGLAVRQPSDILQVRAAMIRGQTRVYIYPTDAEDEQRIPIRRNGSGTWINLITLLGPEGTLVEAGYKEQFVITTVGVEGPFGPAITLDLGAPVDRKPLSRQTRENPEGHGRTQT